MNKKQWTTLGLGTGGLGLFLLVIGNFPGCYFFDSGSLDLIACYVRRYALTVPGMILVVLGICLTIMGWQETKR